MKPAFTKLTYTSAGEKNFLNANLKNWECFWASRRGFLVPDQWRHFIEAGPDGKKLPGKKDDQLLQVMTITEAKRTVLIPDPDSLHRPALREGLWVNPWGKPIARIENKECG